MADWIKEVYEENINPEVIKEYERYIGLGLIRAYNPIDEHKSEEEIPVWTFFKLTEQELLRRIAAAKKIQSEMQNRDKGKEIDF